jgi:hypothetical protein
VVVNAKQSVQDGSQLQTVNGSGYYRLDVLVTDPQVNPLAVFDLKTVSSPLTPSRAQTLLKATTGNANSGVPVHDIRYDRAVISPPLSLAEKAALLLRGLQSIFENPME